MRKNLGWDLNANGTIPQDKNGKSRMFLVRRAKWGEEILEYDGKKLSDGTALKFGSAEFVRQMQMGNLFAYKVGEPKPIQVGYQYSNIHGHARREIAFSEPLNMVKTVETLNPRPTTYPRPGIFKRLIHRFIGSAFKAEFDRYDAGEKANQEWMEKHRSLGKKLDEREKERNKLSKDLKEQVEQLPAGCVYYSGGKAMALNLKATLGPRSGTLMLLSKESGQKNLDVVADQIIEENELMYMDARELAKELDYAGKRNQVNIGMRAMEIRAEKHLDDVTIAEIRQEAGIRQPQKTAGEPENKIGKEEKKLNEQEIRTA